MQRFYFSAIMASLISMVGHSAHADQKLGDVIGTIARTVLEQQQAQHEQALWAGVVENGTAAAYQQYLNTYPQGPNAREAQEQLNRLGAGTEAQNNAAHAEARLGLTQANRMDVQRKLGALGYYKAGVDGVFGAGSRQAVSAWQEARELPNTGYLNARQFRVLLNQPAATPIPASPVTRNPVTSAAQGELNLGLTRTQRVQIQRDLVALGYDTKGADGLFGTGTREAIGAWQRNTGQRATGYINAAQIKLLTANAEARGSEPADGRAAAIDEDLLGLTRNERVRVQQRLIGLGYLNGRADGVFGSATRNALSRWQGDNGLKQSGYLTAEQVRTLREQARI